MNDIRPPRRTQRPPVQPGPPMGPVTSRLSAEGPIPPVEPQPTLAEDLSVAARTPESPAVLKRNGIKKHLIRTVVTLIAAAIVAAIGAMLWYSAQLSAVDSTKTTNVRVVIIQGTTPDVIAKNLREKGLIKNELAFDIYTRLTKTRSSLQAGSYDLRPSQTLPEIVDTLANGRVVDDTITITFYPGAALVDNSDTDEKKKVDVRTVLRRVGFGDDEITVAFKKQYDHPVFVDKPAGADIEGYVYGDTYEFKPDATLDEILTRTFDELQSVIVGNDLRQKFKKRGMTLYEGLTLASIIQREVHGTDDEATVAQVFYKRLAIGMPLGADATFVYVANKQGIAPSVDLDSLYNTRIHKGLPPGPISAPGKSALLAAVNPASTDYLYFVSGDDGKNYFSRTLEEHEAKTRKYCQKNCSLF